MIDNIDFEIKLKGATTPEELLQLVKQAGCELSDVQLKSVTDPSDWSHCPLHDDRPCPDHFYCIRHSG